MNLPGPLLMQPVFLPKVWAAPRLPGDLAEALNALPGTGEVWLASDRHEVTNVAAGDLAGWGLDRVVAQWPEWVLGPGRAGGFPLLVKVLCVGDWLSVQVHPDDAAAQRLEGEPWGKSEAWHVLAAEQGAEIVLGLKSGAGRAEVEQAMARGCLPQVLCKVAAQAGDTFHLPAGKIHATGPGLTIFEVQQASDVTYRFYDWDRPGDDGKPRPLHQEKALACLDLCGPGAPVTPRNLQDGPNRVRLLVEDPHFAMAEVKLTQPFILHWGEGRPRVIFVRQGRGELRCAEAGEAPLGLESGQCWVLPAGLAAPVLEPVGELSLLACVA